jgi:NADH-quinone oxidoreductase subunit K
MNYELALLNDCLLVGAVLFGVGLIGFVCRRNMIVMFLAAEIMLQGISISLAAWSRFHNNFGGQMLIVFIIAVAACEAAIALALITVLFRRSGKLDIIDWQMLRESNQPPHIEMPLPPDPADRPRPWPHLPPAGVKPDVSREETDYRRDI